MTIMYVDVSTAKRDLIREAVEAIERAIALHIDDDESPSFGLAAQDPVSPEDDKGAQRLEKTHEHSSPEWSAIRFSLSSSIHSLDISLSLLHLQEFHSPADRLVVRKKLVDNAKAAGREAFQAALSLCDYAPNPGGHCLPNSPGPNKPLCRANSCEDCLADNLTTHL